MAAKGILRTRSKHCILISEALPLIPRKHALVSDEHILVRASDMGSDFGTRGSELDAGGTLPYWTTVLNVILMAKDIMLMAWANHRCLMISTENNRKT